MPNVFAPGAGAEVVMTSCTDVRHPGSCVLDGSATSFWATTGLFPQEIVIRLPAKASATRIKIASYGLRHVVFERCDGVSPTNWQPYVEQDFPEAEGRQEVTITPPGFPLTFLRMRIASGFTDFVGVYSVELFA